MPIFFNVNYDYVGVLARREGLSARARDQAIVFAMSKVAQFWHRFIFPLHFEKMASRKYKYQKRKRAYSAIKRKLAHGEEVRDPTTGKMQKADVQKGGTTDLVFGGDTEQKAERNRLIVPNRKGFAMTIRVPRYIVMRRRGSYPNFRRELTQVTNDESNVLRKVFMNNYMRAVRSIRNNTTVRI